MALMVPVIALWVELGSVTIWFTVASSKTLMTTTTRSPCWWARLTIEVNSALVQPAQPEVVWSKLPSAYMSRPK